MKKQKHPAMNTIVIIFIAASAALSYMLTRANLEPSNLLWMSRRYGEYFLAMAAFFWIAHAIMSKKYWLNAANTWFCVVITLLAGEIAVWGIYDWDRKWLLYLGTVAFLIYLPIYCWITFINGWITFLTFLHEIAAMVYPMTLEMDNPQTLYQIVNGLRAFMILIAVIQTTVDASKAGNAYAQKKKAERERRAAEREAARVAERREQLPKEIAAMQGYSLNVLPYLAYLQTLTPSAKSYDRMVKSLGEYTGELIRLASEKNAEAEELEIGNRVHVHTN